LAKTLEDELLVMRTEYQKKGSEFIAQKDSLPESIRARRMAEIQDLEQRIQEFYQDVQTQLQQREQELLAPISDKLMKAVESVGEEQGLVYIFDISTPSALMYYSKSKCKDVTNAIRTKLGIR
jgi:outer membrane protein